MSSHWSTRTVGQITRDKLAETGYVAGGSSPEELGKLLKSEIARWNALIKSVTYYVGHATIIHREDGTAGHRRTAGSSPASPAIAKAAPSAIAISAPWS